jgi:type II restriction/modification system DNA methylase subunit YeeA
MNTAQLKTYAPEARRAFIAAVSAQAAKLGITAKAVALGQVQGDVLLIAGQALPASYDKPRKLLIEQIKARGFDRTMEAIAYTWFNRFVAIRYMELHGYLDHGYRVLSHPESQGRPEILDHVADVNLPGLDREKAIELKLDGKKDEELYRFLLLAQCNALHEAMPFLFEKIGDETELLLPANLLHTDSLIRQLVESIDEVLWGEIEIIGWLYQFYISEKKDEVIGKVVKSEDIPAATQLFTPNWIVKYMVQNSLGAQWLATYPDSPLKGQMEYYIEPAEQTPEVQQQLREITPTSLDPETMTLIDPASGSGHILVEAYELFKAIYLERGHRQRDVPELILQKNLFGLDIDERAAQLTGFALMMKGRADDRQLFDRDIKLNVMALQDSRGFDAERLAQGVRFTDYGLQPVILHELKQLFEHATTFGSLIQVPKELAKKLPALKQLSETASQDLFVSEALERLGPLVQQAELLAAQYDAVVANPPYMGGKSMNGEVKKFAKDCFADAKSDLFACFIERGFDLTKSTGHNAMVTMHSWMFLSSFEVMRERILREKTINTMAHLGARAFGSISGEVVQATAFVLRNESLADYRPVFFRLLEGGEDEKRLALASGENRFDATRQHEFKKIPGSPVAYWVSETVRDAFVHGEPLKTIGDTRQGMATSDNNRFLRNWPEVSWQSVCVDAPDRESAKASGASWFPYNKGGEYRKYFGNLDFLVNWENDGSELLGYAASLYGSPTRTIKSISEYFKPSISWSKVSTGWLAMRSFPRGFLFDVAGCCIFSDDEHTREWLLGFSNSYVVRHLLGAISPTLNFEAGQIAQLPLLRQQVPVAAIGPIVGSLVNRAHADWEAYERSWDFQSFPLLTASTGPTSTLESSYQTWITQNKATVAEMKRLEEENNRLFIDAYGLADELTPDVPLSQITLTVNPAYRYGGKLTEEEQWTRFRQDTCEELVSYAIGCIMGRYSLDAPGLVYAHSGNEGFDPSKYATFPADDDGIVPLTDTEWFDDDAAHRLIEFLSVAWDKSHLEANLTFLADNLSPKKNESSRDTIRRYLCDKFFKDHLQTYKKRPIYWLFSSGKQKAFQCLVYLHRYNEGTLARMRSEYVIPLQGKMAARLEQLQGDIQAATSTSHQKRLSQEREKLAKQQVELLAFDEKLRHYADMRLNLDLDDGVKVNYGKFGDLLAEVKAIHGKKPETV